MLFLSWGRGGVAQTIGVTMKFAPERVARLKRDKAQLEAELKPYKDRVACLGKHPDSEATAERIRDIEREIATLDAILCTADTHGAAR